jgi:hypothetical protein
VVGAILLVGVEVGAPVGAAEGARLSVGLPLGGGVVSAVTTQQTGAANTVRAGHCSFAMLKELAAVSSSVQVLSCSVGIFTTPSWFRIPPPPGQKLHTKSWASALSTSEDNKTSNDAEAIFMVCMLSRKERWKINFV